MKLKCGDLDMKEGLAARNWAMTQACALCSRSGIAIVDDGLKLRSKTGAGQA